MELVDICNICEATKGHCWVTVHVDSEGKIRLERIGFWEVDRVNVLSIRKRYNLGTLRKGRVGTDIDWSVDNITFNRVAACKIVGYKTKHIPAHDEREPIFNCP